MQYINIEGDVTEQTLLDVKNALANNDKEITLMINSLGGSLPVGTEIFDLLTTCPPEKHTFYAHCKGNVASSATLILCGVKKENRYASRNTVFLIHNPLISLYGTQNLQDINNIANTMKSASEQIKNIYRLRTDMDDELMNSLMQTETTFYADKALEYGLIGNIEQIVNKVDNYNKTQKISKIMKKSFLNTLVNKLVKALLNENYVAEDGSEVTIDGEIAVGTKASPDGVWVIDGSTITVDGGEIIDIIPAEPIEEPKQEEPVEEPISNEGDGAEPATKPEPAEEPKKEPEQVADDVATKVEEQVKEDDVTDATEIAEIVKKEVETALANKYQPLIDLVNKCGGKEKLEMLSNVKHENQEFETKQVVNKGSHSIEELMAMRRK